MSKSSQNHQQQIDGTPGFSGRIAHSIRQAVLTSGRSRSRIFKAIKDGELEIQKDGRRTFITDAELRRWVGSMPTLKRTPAAGV